MSAEADNAPTSTKAPLHQGAANKETVQIAHGYLLFSRPLTSRIER
jgi:hypothetical protein